MTLLEAALSYAQRGWYVFPCQPGAKIPLGGRGHLDASSDLEQVRQWWAAHPDANIGIAVAPSGLVVLDVDVAEGKPGRASLATIDGELPDTLTAITGRGGLHAVYTRPMDVPAARRIGIKPGLDLIGDGYIVAAPSVLTEGGQYRWNHLIEPVALPQVLRAAAAERPEAKKVQLTGAPLPTGNRNNSLFRLGAALRDQGIGAEALARALDAENQQRCNPPLPNDELALIVNSVLTRVTPTRDVAAGAIVQQEIAQIFAPPTRSAWITDSILIKKPPMRFYATGFDHFDELTGGGLATRRVCGVVGPPSLGKSSLVNTIMRALQKHLPVLHVSTELPRDELQIRYAAMLGGFPFRDGLRGAVPHEALIAAVQGLRVKLIGSDDLDRDDPLTHIYNEAVAIRDQYGVAPAIAIDYVGLMARGTEENARGQIGKLTMRLRQMSQELDCIIVAVFTVSRAYYHGTKKYDEMCKTNDPSAFLAAAKDAGEIEYDCGTIVYTDVDRAPEGPTKPARLIIARCRDGETGFVGARAQLATGLWTGDPTALGAFTTEEREANRDKNDVEAACESLLDLIVKMPNRPWRELKTAVKGSWAAADAARARLLAEGKIEMASEVGYDTMHRPKKRDVLRLRSEVHLEERNTQLALDVSQEDETP